MVLFPLFGYLKAQILLYLHIMNSRRRLKSQNERICGSMENHYINIDNRKRITISQVADVDAFDEDTLWANLKEGGLEITGENLNVEKLDLQDGILIVTGEICSVSYTDKGTKKARGLGRFGKRKEK